MKLILQLYMDSYQDLPEMPRLPEIPRMEIDELRGYILFVGRSDEIENLREAFDEKTVATKTGFAIKVGYPIITECARIERIYGEYIRDTFLRNV